MAPAPGLFPAAFGHQAIHQAFIAQSDGCFALAQWDDLVLAAGLFQGANQPIGNSVPLVAQLSLSGLKGLEMLR